MDKIRTNTDSLRHTEDVVRTQLKAIRQSLTNMQADVKAMNRMWEGPANTAFNQTFLNNIIDLDNMCRALESIASYEGMARREYTQCEGQVGDIVNSIRI